MTHFGLISLFFLMFGVSAVLLATFLLFELIQHRKTYLSDAWSEEALLEERIATGTLPAVTHAIAAKQAEIRTQESLVIKETLPQNVSFVRTAAR